jgi:manganese transport protein
MGEFAIGPWLKTAAWLVAVIIVGLNVKLVADSLGAWLSGPGAPGAWIRLPLFLALAGIAALLAWITLEPWLARVALARARSAAEIHGPLPRPVFLPPDPQPMGKVALALDFSGNEGRLVEASLRFLAPARPALVLLHVAESPSARAFGLNAADLETGNDQAWLQAYATALRELGYQVETALGAGDPAPELARMADAAGAELVILGGHGHRGLSDMIFGTTVEALRHRTRASVLVIPLKGPSGP